MWLVGCLRAFHGVWCVVAVTVPWWRAGKQAKVWFHPSTNMVFKTISCHTIKPAQTYLRVVLYYVKALRYESDSF